MSSFWDFFTGRNSNGRGGGVMDHEPSSRSDAASKRGRYLPMTALPEEPVAPPPKPRPAYGIDDAIKLMRTVPVDDNAELVVRVIRKTLESLSVQLDDIIEDAGNRQDSLRGGIEDHRATIAKLELDIKSRKGEIARLEGELAETTRVRSRLELAQANQTQARPAFVPPTSAAAHNADASAPPPPPLPGGRGGKSVLPSRVPTAIAPARDGVVVSGAEVESIPPDSEPTLSEDRKAP